MRGGALVVVFGTFFLHVWRCGGDSGGNVCACVCVYMYV